VHCPPRCKQFSLLFQFRQLLWRCRRGIHSRPPPPPTFRSECRIRGRSYCGSSSCLPKLPLDDPSADASVQRGRSQGIPASKNWCLAFRSWLRQVRRTPYRTSGGPPAPFLTALRTREETAASLLVYRKGVPGNAWLDWERKKTQGQPDVLRAPCTRC
jgi:hypothetical protein